MRQAVIRSFTLPHPEKGETTFFDVIEIVADREHRDTSRGFTTYESARAAAEADGFEIIG